jgi:hypothetical protein
MKLTLDRLNLEYVNWTLINGEDRNPADLRFGQYIHDKYDMSDIKTDVFYTEGTKNAYIELLKEIYEKHEEQGG